MRFDNKVALVTGAAAGLGRAYAIMLAERGRGKWYRLTSRYRHPSLFPPTALQTMPANLELMQTYCSIIKLGGDIYFVLDVSQRNEVNRMVEEVILRWHRIDILINNAGFTVLVCSSNIKLEQGNGNLMSISMAVLSRKPFGLICNNRILVG